MDEHIRRTMRDSEADPSSNTAARMYEQELLRQGRNQESAESYARRLLCQRQWHELNSLAANPADTARYCDKCDRNVYKVSTVGEFERLSKQRECLAAPLSLVALVGAKRKSAFDPEPHCVAPVPEKGEDSMGLKELILGDFTEDKVIYIGDISDGIYERPENLGQFKVKEPRKASFWSYLRSILKR